MKYFVYIVQCRDGSFYTGSTANIEKRIWEHNLGKRGAKSIRGKRPVQLVYKEIFNSRIKALKREAEIKSWTRKKKENLVKYRSALALNAVKRW
ncbi:MAG: GIY-YIG nuclease family protein [Candidatus Beckwithbacteria bacterium]|nr:GIY-YIG nuclease family protein [Candidatus Beckwithbacteria bacterium]